MLALTLSPTPRKFTKATSSMKPSAIMTTRLLLSASQPKPLAMFEAKAREAVEADVMPEHMTVKHTMKVRKWMPKALWV